MAHTPFEGREGVERKMMMFYLLQLNRYALKNELITEEIYRKIDSNIWIQYDNIT